MTFVGYPRTWVIPLITVPVCVATCVIDSSKVVFPWTGAELLHIISFSVPRELFRAHSIWLRLYLVVFCRAHTTVRCRLRSFVVTITSFIKIEPFLDIYVLSWQFLGDLYLCSATAATMGVVWRPLWKLFLCAGAITELENCLVWSNSMSAYWAISKRCAPFSRPRNTFTQLWVLASRSSVNTSPERSYGYAFPQRSTFPPEGISKLHWSFHWNLFQAGYNKWWFRNIEIRGIELQRKIYSFHVCTDLLFACLRQLISSLIVFVRNHSNY